MGACGTAFSECAEELNEAIIENNCNFSQINYSKFCKKLFEDDKNNEIIFTQLYENNWDEELNEKIIIRKKEKEESRKFVDDNIDDIKTKFDSIIEEKIDKDYLVDLELNKPEKQTERIENIKKLSEEIFQEKTKE